MVATTGDLARVVRKALGHKPHDKKDPATRSFQAVRIHVNDELGELRAGLNAAEALLREGGVLAVVSFHSLEDRIVKRWMQNEARDYIPDRTHPRGGEERTPTLALMTKKPIAPSAREIQQNPRSRSAKLRIAARLDS